MGEEEIKLFIKKGGLAPFFYEFAIKLMLFSISHF